MELFRMGLVFAHLMAMLLAKLTVVATALQICRT
jgi:hypothetical protein